MARTPGVPRGFADAGPLTGVVELRGGLPGGRADAGFTAQAPWTVAWDLKVALLREEGAAPAVAVRADLGILQPSFGVALLTSKTDGALTLTAMVAHSRRSEHVWRKGGRPQGDDTEIIAANVFSWGGGAEFRVAPHGEIFVGVVSQTPSQQHESPRDGAPFAIAERSSWFVSAGYAVHWTMARPPRQVLGTMTTLRGIVLAEPEGDRFEVGEPGIYRAMVFLDASTRFVSGGNDVPRADLKQGRIVLVQGLALPHPSTFLARTIELQ